MLTLTHRIGNVTVVGEIYRVCDVQQTDDREWYEYRLFQIGEDGKLSDAWDSLEQTYNGAQRLDFNDARNAVTTAFREMERDITWEDAFPCRCGAYPSR